MSSIGVRFPEPKANSDDTSAQAQAEYKPDRDKHTERDENICNRSKQTDRETARNRQEISSYLAPIGVASAMQTVS